MKTRFLSAIVVFMTTHECSTARSKHPYETRANALSSLFIDSHEKESALNRELGDRAYIYEIQSGDRSVIVHGTPHVMHTGTAADAIRSTIDLKQPDLLLVEGNAWSNVLKNTPDTDPQTALTYHGEQAYAALYAHQKGIRVAGWDNMKESLLEANKEHPPEILLVLCALMATKIFSENQQKPTMQEVVSRVIGLVGEEALPVRFSSQNESYIQAWAELVRTHTGKTVDTLSLQELERFVSPRFEGPTNILIRQANALRDQHAMEALLSALETHTRVMITAGRSHAITWEPAVNQIFNEESSPKEKID